MPRTAPASQHDELLHRLVGFLPGMVYRYHFDREWTLEFVGPGCRSLTGFEPYDLVESRRASYNGLIHPDDRSTVERVRRESIQAGAGFSIRYRIRRLDGTQLWVWDQGRGSPTGGTPIGSVEGLILDVNEWTASGVSPSTGSGGHEGQRQKLQALSRLAARLAHDMNNVFSVIKGTSQLLAAERAGDEPLLRDLLEIESAVGRGSDLCSRLDRRGGAQRVGTSSASLESVVRSLAPELQRLLGDGRELRVDIESNLPEVGVDRAVVEEVLRGLARNARDAMPGGGSLTVAVTAATSGPDPGRMVQLRVTDTGAGISPHVRDRLFEPFVTTKESGAAGLGLFLIWRMVTDAGGRIEVESSPGRGASFEIFLPIALP